MRQKEVDKIRQEMTKAGKDRVEIQNELMPYTLQREYKAINYRVGDRL